MPLTVNIQDAKTNLSKLVAAALSGEEVIIANRGNALVRLVPYAKPIKRELGMVGGDEHWDNAFFDELPEGELALWDL